MVSRGYLPSSRLSLTDNLLHLDLAKVSNTGLELGEVQLGIRVMLAASGNARSARLGD